MQVTTEHIQYRDSKNVMLEGYAAWRVDIDGPRPGILVAHTAIGPQEDFIRDKVKELAQLGYAGFALDMYGAGQCVFGEAKSKHLQELRDDGSIIRDRAEAALKAMNDLEVVNPHKTVAIGYCLGGKVVLDLARANPYGLKGVVSFHGILDSPQNCGRDKLKPKVLAFHGQKDPYIDSQQLQSFISEMEMRDTDYQLMVYGGTYHAFTRPEKNTEEDRSMGLQYNGDATRRSWRDMLAFLGEVFG